MENFDEDSMPCPCACCGKWFDLHEGRGSDKWFPGTVICSDCGEEEEKEIAADEETEDSINAIEDALYTLREHLPYLAEAGVKLDIDWQKLEIRNKPGV